jgi:hypothetical protein
VKEEECAVMNYSKFHQDQQQQQQQQQQHHHQQQQQQRKGLKNMPPSREWSEVEWSTLPDEIQVLIGKSIAKLCGVRDFIALSSVSQRTKRLLLNSQETVNWIHFGFGGVIPTIDSMARIQVVRRLLKKHPSASVIVEAYCGAPAEIVDRHRTMCLAFYRARMVHKAIITGIDHCDMQADEHRDSRPSMELNHRVGVRSHPTSKHPRSSHWLPVRISVIVPR